MSSRRMRVNFSEATEADADAIAEVRAAAADHPTAGFGKGHWPSTATESSVVRSMRHARLVIGRAESRVVAVARLATKKPWAIDVQYFSACRRPLYLSDMAVAPDWQRRGVGRRCLEEAVRLAHAWPGDSVRLDAYGPGPSTRSAASPSGGTSPTGARR